MGNFVLAGAPFFSSLHGSSAEAGMQDPDRLPDRLRTFEPSQKARVPSLDERLTWFSLDLGVDRPIDATLFGHHNLSRSELANVGYRFRLSEQPIREHQRNNTDSVLSSTNLTDANESDLNDDPYNPGVVWATATVPGVATLLRVGFSTPSLTPAPGTDLQALRALVRPSSAVTGTPPALNIELWESGAPVRVLRSGIPISGETVIAAYFDASELSDSSAAGLECRLVGGASSGISIEFGAVDFLADPKPSLPEAHDTGWLDVPRAGDESKWGGSLLSELANSLGVKSAQFLDLIADAPITARYIKVSVRDLGNEDGFIEAGLFHAGPAFIADRDPEFQTLEIERSTLGGSTLGGVSHAITSWRRRIFPVKLLVSESTAFSLWERIDFIGKSYPVYLVLDRSAPTQERMMGAALVTVDDGSLQLAPMWEKEGSLSRKIWRFVEKL